MPRKGLSVALAVSLAAGPGWTGRRAWAGPQAKPMERAPGQAEAFQVPVVDAKVPAVSSDLVGKDLESGSLSGPLTPLSGGADAAPPEKILLREESSTERPVVVPQPAGGLDVPAGNADPARTPAEKAPGVDGGESARGSAPAEELASGASSIAEASAGSAPADGLGVHAALGKFWNNEAPRSADVPGAALTAAAFAGVGAVSLKRPEEGTRAQIGVGSPLVADMSLQAKPGGVAAYVVGFLLLVVSAAALLRARARARDGVAERVVSALPASVLGEEAGMERFLRELGAAPRFQDLSGQSRFDLLGALSGNPAARDKSAFYRAYRLRILGKLRERRAASRPQFERTRGERIEAVYASLKAWAGAERAKLDHLLSLLARPDAGHNTPVADAFGALRLPTGSATELYSSARAGLAERLRERRDSLASSGETARALESGADAVVAQLAARHSATAEILDGLIRGIEAAAGADRTPTAVWSALRAAAGTSEREVVAQLYSAARDRILAGLRRHRADQAERFEEIRRQRIADVAANVLRRAGGDERRLGDIIDGMSSSNLDRAPLDLSSALRTVLSGLGRGDQEAFLAANADAIAAELRPARAGLVEARLFREAEARAAQARAAELKAEESLRAEELRVQRAQEQRRARVAAFAARIMDFVYGDDRRLAGIIAELSPEPSGIDWGRVSLDVRVAMDGARVPRDGRAEFFASSAGEILALLREGHARLVGERELRETAARIRADADKARRERESEAAQARAAEARDSRREEQAPPREEPRRTWQPWASIFAEVLAAAVTGRPVDFGRMFGASGGAHALPAAAERPTRDYYEVLGVSRDADEDTINRKYRKLAMKYHSDRNPGDDEAAAMFLEVQLAHDVLMDRAKRDFYDRTGFIPPNDLREP